MFKYFCVLVYYIGVDMGSFHESHLKVLSVLEGGPLSFSEVVEASGFSRRTVSRILKDLVAEGLIEKEQMGRFPFACVYSLTDDGRKLLAQATPLDEVVRGLHRFGSTTLIQEKVDFIGGLTVVKPVKVLTRSFLLLGDIEREWLRFLANVYVASPLKIFGRKPLGLIEIRCCWQLVKPDGWKEPDRRVEEGHECFVFDFPAAYDTFYSTLSEKVKGKMAEKRVNWRRVIFHELRAYSFPLQERWRLSKEGKLISP